MNGFVGRDSLASGYDDVFSERRCQWVLDGINFEDTQSSLYTFRRRKRPLNKRHLSWRARKDSFVVFCLDNLEDNPFVTDKEIVC